MVFIINILLSLIRKNKSCRRTVKSEITGAILGVVVVIIVGKCLIPGITLWEIMKIIVQGQGY